MVGGVKVHLAVCRFTRGRRAVDQMARRYLVTNRYICIRQETIHLRKEEGGRYGSRSSRMGNHYSGGDRYSRRLDVLEQQAAEKTVTLLPYPRRRMR